MTPRKPLPQGPIRWFLLSAVCFGLAAAAFGTAPAHAAPPLAGAIFTTMADGTVVNANVQYATKPDVYLDGGPGPHAPSTAAGLPAGDYYFQVTDPSGKVLLSSDHISCRKVHVNSAGVISQVYAGTNYAKQNGNWTPVACQHVQGTDTDHAAQGAVTVQLYPFDDTPNMGGEYKAWMTPVGNYIGPAIACSGRGSCNVNGAGYAPGNYHGFVPSASKTDNYKVRKNGKPCTDPSIALRKFHDANYNGAQDSGEGDVTGWAVDVTDPLGVTNRYYTPDTVLAGAAGFYTFVETTPAGSRETVSMLDNATVSLYPNADPTVVATVAGTCGETHNVAYGNVGTGDPAVCKAYDRNGSGAADGGEPMVSGWMMQLTGTDSHGTPVGPLTQATGPDGCTSFAGLMPGSYTVAELMPSGGGWTTSGPTASSFTVTSTLTGAVITGGTPAITFANYCTGSAFFGTKGYWHNVNGLNEIAGGDVTYANGLPPYATASTYFDAGDEPFDGLFTGGSPVAAATGPAGDTIAGAGTALAEISQFLIDSNASGDPREQLAQQLLAFIFNARHRLDDPGATFLGAASAQSIIDQAITAWQSGDAARQNQMEQLLDWYNNHETSGLAYIHYNACAVAYP